MSEWETMIEFPDYEMNRDGRIVNYHTKRVIEPSLNGKRALKINLRKDGKVCTRSVGRLVCRQFHGEPEYGNTVIFRDNNPTNIHADNLKWGTRSFAWEWTHQSAKGKPRVNRPIERLATGEIYANSLEAALAVEGIERYIVLAASHPDAWWYRQSLWKWVVEKR
jgi:hypothetical protein